MRFLIGLLIVLSLVLLAGSCATSGNGASTTPSTASPSRAPDSTGQTFGQVSDAGRTVFSGSCAKCHGANGQGTTGPALIGSGANLQKYNNAQTLFDYISTNMPFNAPGSLSRQQYLDVLGYLLVQDNFVSASNTFDSNQLNSIPLTK